MDSEVHQLVEMGATAAQARAALKKYKDVMQAAEKIFDGHFDDVVEDEVPRPSPSKVAQAARPATPEEEDDDEMEGIEGEDEDDEDEYMDYDSDDGVVTDARNQGGFDPYAGEQLIFFAKSRREEVIEIQEEPEVTTINGEPITVLSQGDWMRGCPEGSEQSFLFSLYSQLTEGYCACSSGCGWKAPRAKTDFFGIFSDFSTYINHVRRIIKKTCPSCHACFCFACGESAELKERPGASARDDPLFHCSNLQGIILGVGLSMLQQLFAAQTQGDPRESNTRKRKAAGATTSPTPDDDDDEAYYGSSASKKKGGIGYAGNIKEDHSGQLEARNAQKTKDEALAGLLQTIRVYIPSVDREGGGHPSDFLPHPTTLAHLRRRFTHVCSPLLRNDSLSDMSDRNTLYFELFHWLETVSKHESLASMMAMPLMMPISSKSPPANKSSFKGGARQRERVIVYEGSSSPRELLEAIAIQANAALKGLEGPKIEAPVTEMTEEEKRMTTDTKGKEKEASAPVSAENQRLVDFCYRILATINGIDRSLKDAKGDEFVRRLHDSLPKIPTTSDQPIFVTAGTSEESGRAIYVDWATRVRFEYCDLTIPGDPSNSDEEGEIPNYKHFYNNEARLLVNQSIPKRSLAIAKELAVLTTNLPTAYDSSIFLRVDETRVDILKALITGPEGTPYQNGCYLFDIFLGGNYNHSPPSCKFLTTGGGRYRLNPNLYADGKVCLSLLGTWQGPGWISGQSTLLQVLISIQSMILCEEPYLNEPGWANSAGTSQSIAYSNNVKRMVVKTAMLQYLKNPPDPFEDIIKTHFRLKARAISAQLDDWLAKDDGKVTSSDGGGYGGSENVGGSITPFAKDVAEMKERLRQLEKETQ